jgi:hypothetical protein
VQVLRHNWEDQDNETQGVRLDWIQVAVGRVQW